MDLCATFRDDLAAALAPGGGGGRLRLGWHEHILGCARCRALLQAEEALDELMASLPAPRLPADLVRRVLQRLEVARQAGALERLLGRDPEPSVPGDLSARILGGLAAARTEARLDALLDLAGEPEVPAQLAPRVLVRLAGRRRAPRIRRALAWAAAATLLLALGFAWRRLAAGDAGRGEPGASSGPEPAWIVSDVPDDLLEVEDELLATLDLLEVWDELTKGDLDLLLVDTEPVDWALLEHGAAVTSEPGPAGSSGGSGSEVEQG